MNRLSVAPLWTVVKVKLKERFGHLTDNDFAEIELVEEQLLERLMRRVNGSPFEVAHLVEGTLDRQVPVKSFVCPSLKQSRERCEWLIPNAPTLKETTAHQENL